MYPDSVCAIATDAKSQDLVQFLKTDQIKELIEDSVDDYGHHVAAGFCVFKVRYLEQATEKSNRISYRILKKNVYVFKESAVNLIVNFDIRKNYYCDIIM